MTVEESWERIERWIARHAPEEDPLPGPCTPANLERLYEALGARLPQDVERSLLRHDGSGLTDVLPPGYTLLGVEEILRHRAIWLNDGALNDANLEEGEKLFLVPFAALSVTQLLVDTRTGRLGWWDIEQCFNWRDDPLWHSFADVLDFVGSLLASPPPWTATLSGDGAWEVTDRDPDFPRMLVWTEGTVD